MFGRIAGLESVRATATGSQNHPPLGWLDAPPDVAGRFTTLHRSRVVAGPIDDDRWQAAGHALLDWQVQRGAGLRVAADGPAEVGATVAVGLRVGPVWMLAPCRVVERVEGADRVGFTYATLPGHPELGVERFQFVRTAHEVRFEVQAISRPDAWIGRVAPYPARWFQALVTRRYLASGVRLLSSG